jgi:hypothetical protein
MLASTVCVNWKTPKPLNFVNIDLAHTGYQKLKGSETMRSR